MGRLNNPTLENAIVATLRKILREKYPSRWTAFDDRVSQLLDLYIGMAVTAKKPLTNYTSFYVDYFVQLGVARQLAIDFVNALTYGIGSGQIPANPLADVMGFTRGLVASNTALAQKQKEEQAQKDSEPGWFVTLFGQDVADSLGGFVKYAPWVILAGGLAYVYVAFGRPVQVAAKRVIK